ncbi:hypothetical protein AQUCO_02700413v1 [Aquilegia coerulea]|uniref:Very-long-chain 3-oxoacyl-CoA reductase n=1 Tax=Aquilegia coerulea TaxID=218851 RepID=A0A2G5D6S9_AQUCA|nr:hypothetical protein AQUCO_02700413v1 [Aquilegia coerulea]
MELQTILITVTSTIGFISLTKTLVSFCRWVWITFLRPPKNLKDYGSWAIVTGSTDGIGKALVFELALRGLNIVLIGRDSSKLEGISRNILEKCGSQVEVKYIVIDFAKEKSVEIGKKIEKEINGLDVGLLINNVGVGYPAPMYFHQVDTKLIDSLIRVNMDSLTWVTKAVLPVMMKKKRGAIVNIGSSSGLSSIIPSLPLYTIYSATKAYVNMFSRSISLEYKRHGIDVQCQVHLLFYHFFPD